MYERFACYEILAPLNVNTAASSHALSFSPNHDRYEGRAGKAD